MAKKIDYIVKLIGYITMGHDNRLNGVLQIESITTDCSHETAVQIIVFHFTFTVQVLILLRI